MASDPRGAARANTGDSTQENLAAATKHMNIFLPPEIANPVDGKEIAVQLFGVESPPHPTYANVIKKNVSVKVMNRFAFYLAKKATHLKNKNKLIEFRTADSYLSAIKGDVQRSLMYDSSPMLLTDEKMKPVRNGLVNMFIKRNMQLNRPMSQSHKTAYESDLIRIAIICFWSGSWAMAVMVFFLISLVQFAGRATEVAVLPFSRIFLSQPGEFADAGVDRDRIAMATLWRTKTKLEQELSVFHHRDCFLQDWYFAMVHSMVLCEGNASEALFPTFLAKTKKRKATPVDPNDLESMVVAQDNILEAQAAAEEQLLRNIDPEVDDDAAEAKGVSQYFRDCLKSLSEEAAELDELAEENGAFDESNAPLLPSDNGDGASTEYSTDNNATSTNIFNATSADASNANNGGIDGSQPHPVGFLSRLKSSFGGAIFSFQQGLSSHSQKRFAVNFSLQHSLLNTISVCFRSGWCQKALHTLFWYAEHCEKNDQQVARVASKWNIPNSLGRYGGGRPPSLDKLAGIIPEAQLRDFIHYLFQKYDSISGADDQDFRALLTASFLLRLNDFLLFLSEHPGAKFGTTPEENFTKNRFLQLVKVAAERAGIDDPVPTLCSWSDIVEKDFYLRNYEYVPTKDLQRIAGDDATFECSTRSLAGFMQGMAGAFGAVRSKIHEIATSLRNQMVHQLQTRQDLRAVQQQQILIQQQLAQIVRQNALILQQLGVSRVDALQTSFPATVSPAPPSQPSNRNVVASPLPGSLANLTVQSVFVDWHSVGYNQMIGGSSSVRSNIRFSVEHLTLFLDSHIQPLPQGATCGAAAGKEWMDDLHAKTKLAWERVKEFVLREKPGMQLTEKVSSFKKIMYSIDPNNLPEGPSGQSSFQPAKATLRKKEDFIQHKLNNNNTGEQQPAAAINAEAV